MKILNSYILGKQIFLGYEFFGLLVGSRYIKGIFFRITKASNICFVCLIFLMCVGFKSINTEFKPMQQEK